MNERTIVIELLGPVPSKKNRYMPKAGGRGVFKNYQLQREIDQLALQIPSECRNLELRHPNIDIYEEYENARSDRDNALTTILDILVQMRVLKNDNVAHCNGHITLHPASVTGRRAVKIILTRTDNDLFQ